jgi:serine/threonine protein kinase
VVLGDLHPNNVMLTPDGRVVLIDLEIASLVDEGRRPTMGDPAFIAPKDRTGFAIDRYALAALRLYVFMPLTTLIGLDRSKAGDLAAEIAALFPVPRDFLSEAVHVITGEAGAEVAAARATGSSRPAIEPDPHGWRRARDSMVQAILGSATPERDDRLFPGDPRQFELGGLGIAYGAAGVLYALSVTGGGRHPDYEDWLVRRATHPESGTRLGFYDGLHGVAHVL